MKLLHFGTDHLHVFFVKADQTYDSFFFLNVCYFSVRSLKIEQMGKPNSSCLYAPLLDL